MAARLALKRDHRFSAELRFHAGNESVLCQACRQLQQKQALDASALFLAPAELAPSERIIRMIRRNVRMIRHAGFTDSRNNPQ
jgi:hypothetical protein